VKIPKVEHARIVARVRELRASIRWTLERMLERAPRS
jgi:hypothetical protein